MTLPPAEPVSITGTYNSATTQLPINTSAATTATISTNNSSHPSPSQAPLTSGHCFTTPASSYPHHGNIDPNVVYELHTNGYEPTDPQQLQQQQQQHLPPQQPQPTYVIYPVSPQFYYSDYQSYPGSPVLLPQSPPMNPTSPPFSPTYQYQGGNNGAGAPVNGGNMTLSPSSHATYMLPTHHSVHPAPPLPHFPPLHISSPVLSGTPVGSLPHQMVTLPGPYSTPPSQPQYHHRHHHQQQQQQRHYGRRKNQQSQTSNHHHQNLSLREHSYNQQATMEELSMNHHPQNIYVRGLSSSTTDESFLELCKAYGPVTSSKAILDQKTGECKGYGFALFEQEQDCHTAIDGLNHAGLQASFARVGQESFSSRLRNLQDETSTNIYISNLPLDMTEQKLEELFQPFQTVSSRILRDPRSGISRGVGFARMCDRLAAISIIERFSGHVIAGSSASLQVRFADSPAQKNLKNQTTTRKRVIRPREFQSMSAGFSSMQHMMPITPETMLGISPSNPPAPYSTTMTQQQSHHPLPVIPSTAASMNQASPRNLDSTKHQDTDQVSHTKQENLNTTESAIDNNGNIIE
ncbi:hypothetical protein BCR42DRAFT_422506 [Absidia repens]|uniref:RRM domain-containing protein n=1 Tax=Absidia repens TaxID=90262 RepID=A0A1X2I6K8_9FUNG|nr:hypothetical protein BCR42DRAFT_422506 [Absidia repens]